MFGSVPLASASNAQLWSSASHLWTTLGLISWAKRVREMPTGSLLLWALIFIAGGYVLRGLWPQPAQWIGL